MSFRNFVSCHHTNRFFVDLLIDDDDVNSRRRATPSGRHPRRIAPAFTLWCIQHLFHVFNLQAVFCDVLNVSVRVVFRVAENGVVGHGRPFAKQTTTKTDAILNYTIDRVLVN